MGEQWIRRFDTVGRDDVPLAGGKDASLGELRRSLVPLGVRVPALLLALSACHDQPVATAAETAAEDRPTLLAELRCEADVLSATFACDGAGGGAGTGGAAFTRVIVGGQHHYVRLANTGTTVDAEAGTFTTTVTVQNLLLAPMSTAAGIRVFLASGPTNGVTVANATGRGFFLGAEQDYFQYSGWPTYGLLDPGVTSEERPWMFHTHGASSFGFTVYVQAEVPAGDAHTARFSQVSAGNGLTCALTPEGRAYCWGDDRYGALGDGSGWKWYVWVPSPVRMPPGVSFTRITAGTTHACALASDGRAYCWGSDILGKLGNGAALMGEQHVPSLVQMPAGVSFTDIGAADGHTCALVSDGRAYCWGFGGSGALGRGPALYDDQHAPSPVEMPAGVGFTRITGGYGSTCALDSDDQAWCWGYDGYSGKLGLGARTYRQYTPARVEMPAGVSFTDIAVGGHTCALARDGRAYCWGRDNHGELGNGTTIYDRYAPSAVEMPAGVTFTRITAGQSHTCALGSDSRAYCWGSDRVGELGNGTTPTADQHAPFPVQMPSGTNLTGLTAGGAHTCAFGAGPAYCWGTNRFWVLGDGTDVGRPAPVVVAGTR